MRIAVGSDHAAVGMRQALVAHLEDRGHTVHEAGPEEGQRVDYPDLAAQVAYKVARSEVDLGVLLCGTGIGMSMAANKVRGVRAALVHDHFTARMAAQHNRANVLCLGARLMAVPYGIQLVDEWLETPFEARHEARLNKLHAIENTP